MRHITIPLLPPRPEACHHISPSHCACPASPPHFHTGVYHPLSLLFRFAKCMSAGIILPSHPSGGILVCYHPSPLPLHPSGISTTIKMSCPSPIAPITASTVGWTPCLWCVMRCCASTPGQGSYLACFVLFG